jgi:hypothetical protein
VQADDHHDDRSRSDDHNRSHHHHYGANVVYHDHGPCPDDCSVDHDRPCTDDDCSDRRVREPELSEDP